MCTPTSWSPSAGRRMGPAGAGGAPVAMASSSSRASWSCPGGRGTSG